jgi:hypothetical protein
MRALFRNTYIGFEVLIEMFPAEYVSSEDCVTRGGEISSILPFEPVEAVWHQRAEAPLAN